MIIPRQNYHQCMDPVSAPSECFGKHLICVVITAGSRAHKHHILHVVCSAGACGRLAAFSWSRDLTSAAEPLITALIHHWREVTQRKGRPFIDGGRNVWIWGVSRLYWLWSGAHEYRVIGQCSSPPEAVSPVAYKRNYCAASGPIRQWLTRRFVVL